MQAQPISSQTEAREDRQLLEIAKAELSQADPADPAKIAEALFEGGDEVFDDSNRFPDDEESSDEVFDGGERADDDADETEDLDDNRI